jgi:hypothetical protein
MNALNFIQNGQVDWRRKNTNLVENLKEMN